MWTHDRDVSSAAQLSQWHRELEEKFGLCTELCTSVYNDSMTQTHTTTSQAPASEKQVAYILALLEKKTGYTEDFAERLPKALAAGAITKQKASEIIDWLRRREDAPKTAGVAAEFTTGTKVDITDGFWITDAPGDSIDVWKVQWNLAKTNLYAKKLHVTTGYDGKKKGTFDYTPGGLKMLAGANPRVLTVDEAKAYGKLYGVCCRCGRNLTHEDSIDRMMGPVCYKYLVEKGHGLK